jgi:moderate conductance mechanosensitive channel
MTAFMNGIQKYWDLIFQYNISKFILAALLTYMAVKIINRLVHTFFKRTSLIDERKEKTLEAMIGSIISYIATFGLIVYTLSLFGVEVGQLLAGAGIIGIIVGLGAQSLIKDFLSGIFLLYEKQLLKGDFITVNNTFHGTVEDIGLRFLKIREWSGKLITISNGQVSTIQNYNFEHMRVIEKVTTSFYEDPSKVMNVLEKACDQLNRELAHHLKKDETGQPIEKYQVYGMTSLNEGYRGYQFTVIGLVYDDVYWVAARQVRLILAKVLYQHKIEMAIQNIDVRSASSPELD